MIDFSIESDEQAMKLAWQELNALIAQGEKQRNQLTSLDAARRRLEEKGWFFRGRKLANLEREVQDIKIRLRDTQARVSELKEQAWQIKRRIIAKKGTVMVGRFGKAYVTHKIEIWRYRFAMFRDIRDGKVPRIETFGVLALDTLPEVASWITLLSEISELFDEAEQAR